MDLDTFAQRLVRGLPQGLVLDNPGGGTSTVIGFDGVRLRYLRGGLKLKIEMRELYEAYLQFAGHQVTTSQLKDYHPSIFDSDRKGHNCHCTFLFLALKQAGLAGEVWGHGRKGSPFGATFQTPTQVT